MSGSREELAELRNLSTTERSEAVFDDVVSAGLRGAVEVAA